MKQVQFNIPSISCSVCSGKIKEGLKNFSGVENIDVDLKTQSVNIGYDPHSVSPAQIRSKISSMGYEVLQ